MRLQMHTRERELNGKISVLSNDNFANNNFDAVRWAFFF